MKFRRKATSLRVGSTTHWPMIIGLNGLRVNQQNLHLERVAFIQKWLIQNSN